MTGARSTNDAAAIGGGGGAGSPALNRLIAEAATLAGGDHPCHLLGHKWVSLGGANCGCEHGACSVPVHECPACGDCDYGDNEEATEIRTRCNDDA